MKKCSILKEENSTHSDRTIDNGFNITPVIDNLESQIDNLKAKVKSLKSQLAECIESHGYQTHLADSLYKQISGLIDENKALEKQLADIKYLSREEVEEIFDEELPDAWDYNEEKRFTMQDQYNIISAICNLAIPDIKQKDNWQVIASGEVKKDDEQDLWLGNMWSNELEIKILSFIFKKSNYGKNIEIAVRVKEEKCN